MRINSKHLFPILLVVLNLGAAAMSFSRGNMRMTLYWCASATALMMIGFSD